MRASGLLLAAVLVAPALAGCVSDDSGPSVANPLESCGALDTEFSVDRSLLPKVRVETSNGTFEMAVYASQVPLTAANFKRLVEQDFYNDTRFHRIVEDEFIQGGDPFSESRDRRLWGSGGPGYAIPDEYHQFLRHDRPGVVGMAQAKPNTAGSQFLIDLSENPGFNDQSSVFAQVVEGMNVVRAIAQTPTDDQGRPTFGAEVHGMEWIDPEEDPRTAAVRVSAYGYDCVQAAEPGGKAEYLLAVRNTGQRILNGTYSTDLSGNWSGELRDADRVVVSSGQTVAYVLDVEVPNGTVGETKTFNFTVDDPDSDVRTSLEFSVNVGQLGPKPAREDPVDIRYVGILEDGRPFDTTEATYTEAPSLTWFRPRPEHLEPVTVEVGTGAFVGQPASLVDGMTELLNRGKIGQSVVGKVPPSDGYGKDSWGQNNLGGRLLFFQMELEPSSVN